LSRSGEAILSREGVAAVPYTALKIFGIMAALPAGDTMIKYTSPEQPWI
jgi:DMSO reductase anchor subunit